MRIVKHCLVLVIVFCSTLRVLGQNPGLQKTANDVTSKYTRVGNIRLTVTNFGTVGTRNAFWPRQPSCEYPRGSRIEHIYQGGLWVGAIVRTADTNDTRKDQYLVSTGASDQSTSTRGLKQGFEFTNEIGDSITELTSLENDRPPGAQFSTSAISHQDFICDYSDRNTRVPQTNDSIANHSPLGIKVHQESYAWNFPFADFFVIMRYVIKNVSVDTLDSVYVGFWNNAVVRNTNLVRPGTTGYFDHGGFGYVDSLRMAYAFDYDGVPGGIPAKSYVGVVLLGAEPFPAGLNYLDSLHAHTFYNAWRFRASVGQTQPSYESPTDDYRSDDPFRSRYSRMTQSIPQLDIDPLRTSAGNYSFLLSTGPFNRLNPNDSVVVVFGVVCAKLTGLGEVPVRDTRAERTALYANAKWAQLAYNGEDINGNNKLEPNEDIIGDGILHRYTLPQPPRKPIVHAAVENQSIVIYWDSLSAQGSTDPITHQKDFEGYRIYRSPTGADFLSHDDFVINLMTVGEFDRPDDAIGYNTGFSAIKLDSPKTFEPDTLIYHLTNGDTLRCIDSCLNVGSTLYIDTLRAVRYYYRYPPTGSGVSFLNGWQYLWGISAFDSGDAENNIPSLESAKSFARVVPGTLPTSDKSKEIGVYPNPYYVNAYWDGSRERLRKIYFYNLPARCEIRIYTLAGDVVSTLQHDAATYDGTEIEWFNQFGDPGTRAQFAGGEHAWNLITSHDQAIATGLYLFTVEDKSTGNIKRGRFLIIK